MNYSCTAHQEPSKRVKIWLPKAEILTPGPAVSHSGSRYFDIFCTIHENSTKFEIAFKNVYWDQDKPFNEINGSQKISLDCHFNHVVTHCRPSTLLHRSWLCSIVAVSVAAMGRLHQGPPLPQPDLEHRGAQPGGRARPHPHLSDNYRFIRLLVVAYSKINYCTSCLLSSFAAVKSLYFKIVHFLSYGVVSSRKPDWDSLL